MRLNVQRSLFNLHTCKVERFEHVIVWPVCLWWYKNMHFQTSFTIWMTVITRSILSTSGYSLLKSACLRYSSQWMYIVALLPQSDCSATTIAVRWFYFDWRQIRNYIHNDVYSAQRLKLNLKIIEFNRKITNFVLSKGSFPTFQAQPLKICTRTAIAHFSPFLNCMKITRDRIRRSQ